MESVCGVDSLYFLIIRKLCFALHRKCDGYSPILVFFPLLGYCKIFYRRKKKEYDRYTVTNGCRCIIVIPHMHVSYGVFFEGERERF